MERCESEGPLAIERRDRGWRLRLSQTAAHVRADLSFAVVDTFLIIMAYAAALVLRFTESESGIPERWLNGFLATLPVIVAVHLLANVAFGTYGHVWEYASVAEAARMIGATLFAAIALFATVVVGRNLFPNWDLVPIGVVAMGSMLTLGGMGAVRFRSRMFSFRRSLPAARTQKALVGGSGRMAAQLAHQLPEIGEATVAGFVSTNGQQQRLLAGLPVLGTLEQIDRLIAEHGIEQIVVAGSPSNQTMKDLVDYCLAVEVRLRIVPDLDTSLASGGLLGDIRDLELADLLPRPAVTTDLAGASEVLRGRRILVTGAGGSIGSEVVRQVLQCQPEEVVALDHDETHLFEAGLSWIGHANIVPILCDVRDGESLDRVFSAYRPQVIFHAAAHKHVPILENSVAEAVKTNILATQNVLESSRQPDTERFVLISTDKAVRPTSVMGSSKRVAEMLVQAESIRNPRCRYSSVRFGNVLGSRGSVIPTFMRQIQQGGPVTVTDPEMVRYFMTVDEAVQLVLQAAALTENGETFVLDMGEPIKIIDLAHRLIRLAGLVPGQHIQVETIGARPGEKIREFLTENQLRPAQHPKIHLADPPFPGPVTLMEALATLRREVAAGTNEAMRKTLHSLALGAWSGQEEVSLKLFEDSRL